MHYCYAAPLTTSQEKCSVLCTPHIYFRVRNKP